MDKVALGLVFLFFFCIIVYNTRRYAFRSPSSKMMDIPHKMVLNLTNTYGEHFHSMAAYIIEVNERS